MKKTLISLFIFLSLLFVPLFPTHAQLLKGFSSDCLGARATGDKAEVYILSGRSVIPRASTKTYVFMCIDLKNGGALGCSTGNKQLDSILGIALREPAVTLSSGHNPTYTTSDSKSFVFDGAEDKITLGAWTEHLVYHRFYWVQAEGDASIEQVFPTGPEMTNEVGSDNGLKIAQLIFEKTGTDLLPTGIPNEGTKCANIGWDPRGFVFDANTLHPVKDISVLLTQKQKDGTFLPVDSNGLGVTNPYITSEETGHFNFYVSPGLYKLSLVSSNATIADKSSINSAWRDFFPEKNIYQANAEVEEIAGTVAVAHIPVVVSDKNMLIQSLNIINTGSEVVLKKVNNTRVSMLHFFGAVSHPKSKMIISKSMIDEAGNAVEIAPTIDYVDEVGEFERDYEQSQISATGKKLFLQNVNIKFELNPFYTTGAFSSAKSQSPISVDVKPIPAYLEGVAYDTNGSPIPNAIVGIYPYFSTNPMYITIADEKGQFKIGSQHISQVEYVLKYKKPSGEVLVVEPAKFIKQNVVSFSKKGVSPFSLTTTSPQTDVLSKAKVDKVVTTRDLQSLANASMPSNRVAYQDPVPTTSLKSSAGSSAYTSILIVAIALIVLVSAAVIVGVQMKNKQSSTF